MNSLSPYFSSKGISGSFIGHLKFFACPGSSSKGEPCPRGSFVHAPYCRFHLRQALNLDVDTSSIPGAGRGLFSLTSRLVGDHLVDYFGEVLDAATIEERYPINVTGIYALMLSRSFCIDSALVRGVGAAANAPPPKVRPNAKFVVNPRNRSARLEVLRHIKAGDEIFVSYGDEYGEVANCKHTTSDVPEWEWDLSDPFSSQVPLKCLRSASAPEVPSARVVEVSPLTSTCPAPLLWWRSPPSHLQRVLS